MFTGIVEELGSVVDLTPDGEGGARLGVRGPVVTDGVAHGDSIAISGVCLTVTASADDTFTVDVMAETLSRTSLGSLAPGDPVNLERALPASGRFGGHIVQGHVDGVGHVVDRVPGGHWETVRFAVPAPLSRYLAAKGSVAVDGVSLTVIEAGDESFTVGLIPTTLAATTLGRAAGGTVVNLEMDVVAKYLERLVAARSTR